MSKYFKNISLRLFFILLGSLILLSISALIRGDELTPLLGILTLIVLGTLAWWLAQSLNRITRYAENMAANRPATKPPFGDTYLYRLVHAITQLRQELNHKHHIEHYIHGLTHELKTPLTAQQAALELLDDGNLNTEQQQLLAHIQRNSEKMQQLINRLLQLAQLENREHLENPQHLDLIPLIDAVVQDNHTLLQQKALHAKYPHTQAHTLTGDKLLLQQAINNLLQNAIDFAEPNSQIDITIQTTASQTSIHIHNQGAPIPDYALKKIPQRFYSLARADGRRSSGLGLSFSAEIMRLHHGQLQITNDNHGVTASLIFPHAP